MCASVTPSRMFLSLTLDPVERNIREANLLPLVVGILYWRLLSSFYGTTFGGRNSQRSVFMQVLGTHGIHMTLFHTWVSLTKDC